jgi:hypothetical protein
MKFKIKNPSSSLSNRVLTKLGNRESTQENGKLVAEIPHIYARRKKKYYVYEKEGGGWHYSEEKLPNKEIIDIIEK